MRRVGESSTGVWYVDDRTGMHFQMPHPRCLTDEERRRVFDPIENAKVALRLRKEKPVGPPTEEPLP